jgi:glycine/D-amino acid oxidase-like deaminating enzyme
VTARLRKEVEMKTLIVGAGVIGSFHAARLEHAGQDVEREWYSGMTTSLPLC